MQPENLDQWKALTEEQRQALLATGWVPPFATLDNSTAYPAAPPQAEGTDIKESL